VSVCLDSWAVLAWLDGDEPAAGRVDAVVASRPIMSWINLAEVYYRVSRDHGANAAETVLARLRATLTLDEVTPERTLDAARVKAQHAIALADCFAVATAAAHSVPLLTGDPELLGGPDRGCLVEDLRS
jgi:PIN domain nuclease of toxin-antitoxin system